MKIANHQVVEKVAGVTYGPPHSPTDIINILGVGALRIPKSSVLRSKN